MTHPVPAQALLAPALRAQGLACGPVLSKPLRHPHLLSARTHSVYTTECTSSSRLPSRSLEGPPSPGVTDPPEGAGSALGRGCCGRGRRFALVTGAEASLVSPRPHPGQDALQKPGRADEPLTLNDLLLRPGAFLGARSPLLDSRPCERRRTARPQTRPIRASDPHHRPPQGKALRGSFSPLQPPLSPARLVVLPDHLITSSLFLLPERSSSGERRISEHYPFPPVMS